MYVDAHVHCAELDDLSPYIRGDIVAVCVSDDLVSSRKTLSINTRSVNIVPCVGVHPWLAHEVSPREVMRFLNEEVAEAKIGCLGEVGLDKRFKAETLNAQIEVFKVFLEFAKEYDLVLNIHAAGAWREVFELLVKYDVGRAYFHWYTGPLELLNDLTSIGYYVGINPAVEIQEKHRAVVEKADLEHVLSESDAPYEYRGLKMTPESIKKVIEYIAAIKGVEVEFVKAKILYNFKALFRIPL